MATSTPLAFQIAFQSREGSYELSYDPAANELGTLIVCGLAPHELRWVPEALEQKVDCWELAGLTTGTAGVWGDTYWFVLRVGCSPTIEYWGDRTLVRTDASSVRSDSRRAPNVGS